MSKKILNQKIFTDKNKNAIPYITSYYKKNWGFCMSYNDKLKLKGNKFKVFIDSKFIKGNLIIGELLLKGKNKRNFFSTYLCHPSMANNELSGPVIQTALINFIKKYKRTKFSYRFVYLPETIGSIILSKNLKKLKKYICWI